MNRTEVLCSAVQKLFSGDLLTEEEKSSLQEYVAAGFLMPDIGDAERNAFITADKNDETFDWRQTLIACVISAVRNGCAKRFGE